MQIETHEAGHAVAAHVLGKTGYGCRVWKDAGFCGPGDLPVKPNAANYTPAAVDSLYTDNRLSVLADDACLTAAGFTAEAMATFSPVVTPSFCDRQMIDASYRKAFPDCTDFDASRAWAALAVGRARSILSARWGAVEAIAAVLEKEGVCPAETVKQIMDDNP